LAGLTDRRGNVDAETFAPHLVHPLAPINLDLQIPKKAINARWKPGSGSAPTRPGWRSRMPG
jgi:hypothetical protein